jgi:DNA-binding XRE family transcriptional regulator
MSATVRPKARWDTRAYATIVSARHDADALVVRFADGSEARVPTVALEPPKLESPRWADLVLGEFEVTVPTATGPAEISWFSLRVLSDPEFDAHVAAVSAEADRATAEKLRHFREERGLSVEDLAGKAGLSPDALRRVEAAEDRPTFDELKRILAPLGRRLANLAEDADPDGAEETDDPGRVDAPNLTS